MRILPRNGLPQLLAALADRGYSLKGPKVKDDAIVLDTIEGVDGLPLARFEQQAPGSYRLKRRKEGGWFDHTVGPHSWKQFLFPPRETLFTVVRGKDGSISFKPGSSPKERYALIGVRPCDLAAIRIQDRVFTGGPYQETRYSRRRRSAFIVAVNCLKPGKQCFCASTGTGPQAREGFDLCLTELPDRFLVEAGSSRGRKVLNGLTTEKANKEDRKTLEIGIGKANAAMGRTMRTKGLPELIMGNLESDLFDAIAERCTACGNCTQVCPTCFCSTVEERSDLTGATSSRERVWESCFSEEHAYIHGGTLRPEIGQRYRQWFSHKLSSWHSQYGSSGCVGCGRCITWCPPGIDITEEVANLWSKAEPPVPIRPVQEIETPPEPEDLLPRSVELLRVEQEIPGVVTLHLQVGEAFSYGHGQFNMLSVPGIGEAPISISGGGDGVLQHTVRDAGAVTAALTGLAPKERLGMRGPYGTCWPINEAKARSVMVVAGGIGIAPLRSALREMIANPTKFPKVNLIYGAREPQDLLYTTEMLGWTARPNFHLDVTVDRSDLDWRGHLGVVTRLIRRHALPPDGLYLICGPEIMMKFTVNEMLAGGIPKKRIYLSLERNMKCGVGLCGRCQHGPNFVCKDGPIFRYDRVAHLFGRGGF